MTKELKSIPLPKELQLLTIQEVQGLTKFSISGIYYKVRKGTFPAPIKTGPNSIRWFADELSEWMNSSPRSAGQTIQDTQPQRAAA